MPRISRLRRIAVLGLLALAVAGCRTTGESPTPTPGSTPRPFTVMSTDRIRVTDPAAITDTALRDALAQRLPAPDDRGSGTVGPQARRRPRLPVHLLDQLHLHAERGPGLPQRASPHLQRRQVQHRAGGPPQRARLVHLAAVLVAPDRDPRRQDHPIRAQPGRHPVRLGPGLADRLDRRRGVLRRRRDPGAQGSDRRLRPVQGGQIRRRPTAAEPVPGLRRPQSGADSRTRLSHRPRLGDDRGRHDQRRRRRGLAGAGCRGRHPAQPAGGAEPGEADRRRIQRDGAQPAPGCCN